jgi:hypothetical protein
MFFAWWRHVSAIMLLFLFFFSLYMVTMSGAIHYGDEMEKYRVAQSIIERGDFTFRPTAQRNVIGISGRTVSGYELGQTLIEVPFYVLGKLAYTIFPVTDSNWLTMLWVGLLNPVITALVLVLFFKTARLLDFRFTVSFGLALVLGLSTIIFPYSRSFTREPLLTLFLLLALYTSFQFSKTFAQRWLLLTGLTLGYLVFTKFIHGVVIPVFLLYLLIVISQREQQRGTSTAQTWTAILRGVLVVISPGILFLIAQMLYAFVRFGNLTSGLGGLPSNPIDVIIRLLPLATPLEATLGLLFSLDKSIFLYSPPIILGLVGWWRWWRIQPREALFALALVLVEFIPVTWRWDWAGGTWWGPRYLVQITPLLVLPLGFLFDSNRPAQKKWLWMLSGLAVIGFPIQVVGALVNDRDYLDVTGLGSTLLGQVGFLSRGAFDSLVLYLSPEGFPVRINPFGILLIAVILFLAGLIVVRWRQGEEAYASWRANGVFLTGILLIEAFGFITWIVAPYSQVVAIKGDTRYVAANNFLAEGKQCEAIGFYAQALARETHYQAQAAARLEQLWQPAQGKRIPISNPTMWIDAEGEASFEEDSAITITGNGSFRFFAPADKDASVSIAPAPLPAVPNAAYELSGWVKSLAIYGSGYGFVSIFEDDGNWGKGRTTDVRAMDETSGWQLFRKTITTLPTTRRLFVKMGLYKTYGTFWVDGIQLIKVDPNLPQPQPKLPPCK